MLVSSLDGLAGRYRTHVHPVSAETGCPEARMKSPAVTANSGTVALCSEGVPISSTGSVMADSAEMLLGKLATQ